MSLTDKLTAGLEEFLDALKNGKPLRTTEYSMVDGKLVRVVSTKPVTKPAKERQ